MFSNLCTNKYIRTIYMHAQWVTDKTAVAYICCLSCSSPSRFRPDPLLKSRSALNWLDRLDYSAFMCPVITHCGKRLSLNLKKKTPQFSYVEFYWYLTRFAGLVCDIQHVVCVEIKLPTAGTCQAKLQHMLQSLSL